MIVNICSLNCCLLETWNEDNTVSHYMVSTVEITNGNKISLEHGGVYDVSN